MYRNKNYLSLPIYECPFSIKVKVLLLKFPIFDMSVYIFNKMSNYEMSQLSMIMKCTYMNCQNVSSFLQLHAKITTSTPWSQQLQYPCVVHKSLRPNTKCRLCRSSRLKHR